MAKEEFKQRGRELALREMSEAVASAADALSGSDSDLLSAASSELRAMASRTAARAEAANPAVLVLDENATQDELRAARRSQATRRGKDVYLPSWSPDALVLPTAFLRTALFSSSRSIAGSNAKVIEGNESILVSGKPIGSLNNLSVTFSGYLLCQMDRVIYSACLEYYRNRPLTPRDSDSKVVTTFYQLATKMGRSYSANLHASIHAGLLRLSRAQVDIRYKDGNIHIPQLLSVSFDDGYAEKSSELRGSDHIEFSITEAIAELFGPGSWTSANRDTAKRIDLMGWAANFYATHSTEAWLSLEKLYAMSGYEANTGGFRRSLTKILEKLKTDKAPVGSQVSVYSFTKEEPVKLRVKMAAWEKK